MRKFVVASVLTLGLGMWGCSGGYSTGNTNNPSAPTPTTSNGVVTINVVAMDGAQSFSPNPATLPPGQMVVWHNVNNTTHRVVLNDRSVDTGSTARLMYDVERAPVSAKPAAGQRRFNGC